MTAIITRRRDPIELKRSKTEFAGFFTLRIGRMQSDGTVNYTREYSFPNLITDQGLNRMGENMSYNSCCQVGTGTTTPAFSDTGLVTPIGSTGSLTSTGSFVQSGIVAGPPRYAFDKRTHRFAAGNGTGNLTEIGISWATGTGSTLYNRALILDGFGLPTTIAKLADEILDVTYELRTYVQPSDVTGTITISGSDYDYIIRAMRGDTIITDTSAGWGPTVSSGSIFSGTSAFASGVNIGAFTGNITAITSSPSGGYGGPAAVVTSSAYVSDSLERVGKHVYGLGGSPIRTIGYRCGWASYQCQFDPAIPKGAGNQFEVQFIHSWARRSI